LACGTQPLEERSPSDSGSVVRVDDGDTVQVKLDRDGAVRRVRLIGVDTPERDDSREDERYWAELATRFAVHHLLGRRVSLSYDWEREDRYGRTLAYVWTERGELFNRRLILEGFSPAFLSYRFRKDYRTDFRRDEAEARREGRGRWRKEDPEALEVEQARGHAGEYGAVRFRCSRVTAGRRYHFLWTADSRFQALVSKNIAWPKPAASHFPGREWSVTGILEPEGNILKVYVLFPRQMAERN